MTGPASLPTPHPGLVWAGIYNPTSPSLRTQAAAAALAKKGTAAQEAQEAQEAQLRAAAKYGAGPQHGLLAAAPVGAAAAAPSGGPDALPTGFMTAAGGAAAFAALAEAPAQQGVVAGYPYHQPATYTAPYPPPPMGK